MDDEEEKAPEINSDREALQMAEKLLEYARYKGNEKLSLVLSKSTDLLQEIVIRNQKQSSIYDYFNSAGNNFSLFRGHVSFQIFLLVGHLTNWTGHNLLTDNTLKKTTQDVLVTCSVIVSDHNVKLAGHFQNLVGQCPMTDCYFQHCFKK